MSEAANDTGVEAEVDAVDDFAFLNVLVIPQTETTREAMQDALSEFASANIKFSPNGGAVIRAIEAETSAPDVVFFEASDQGHAQDLVSGVMGLSDARPGAVIPLLPQQSRTATLRLIKAGAFDVMSTKPDPVEVYRALARSVSVQRSEEEEEVEDHSGEGAVIVFMHADGGAGATSLAVNSAVELQKSAAEEGGVCLIDFDLQFGGAHLHLDLPVQTRLLPIIRNPRRLDLRILDDLMVEGPLGLRVLTAPESSLPLDALEPEVVDSIVSLARRKYRYVIIDLPVTLTRWTATVLEHATETYVVTQLNVASVRSTRHLLDTLRVERVEVGRLTVVANRVGDKSGVNNLSVEKVAKALDAPVEYSVPNDYASFVEAVNSGTPLTISRPASKSARSVAALVSQYAGARPQVEAPSLLGAIKSLRIR